MFGVGKHAANPRRDRLGEAFIEEDAHSWRRDSCGRIDEKPALALGGECQALEHILVRELRKVGEEFRLCRA